MLNDAFNLQEDTADQESRSGEGEELDAVEQSPTVKVMGMEMTASCESGQKCSRPTTPIIPTPPRYYTYFIYTYILIFSFFNCIHFIISIFERLVDISIHCVSYFSNVEREKTPPKPIYLEGALPPQCELLVTDSETQAEKSEDDDDAPVVLSGKMTLSLISLDQIAAVRKY